MSDPIPQTAATAAKAAREHEAIVRAVRELETALTRPAALREAAWKQDAVSPLRGVIEALETHRQSAEKQGGVIAEAETVLGRPPALAAALSQHKRLTKAATKILAALDEGDGQTTVQEIRRLGWRLAASLHEHRAIEADLIMEAFQHDIGGQG